MATRYGYDCPACDFGVDCNDTTYHVEFEDCGDIIKKANITGVWIAPADFDTTTPAFDWADLADWTAAITVTGTGGIKYYSRIAGGLPPVDRPRTELADFGLTQFDPFPFAMELEVVDVNATNHIAFRTMQACPSLYRLWYETDDQLLWGGEFGILAEIMPKLSSPRGGYISYLFDATWKANCMPDFIATPFV